MCYCSYIFFLIIIICNYASISTLVCLTGGITCYHPVSYELVIYIYNARQNNNCPNSNCALEYVRVERLPVADTFSDISARMLGYLVSHCNFSDNLLRAVRTRIIALWFTFELEL